MGEFDLIDTYFKRPELAPIQESITGIGDDCALLTVPEGMQLAQSLDTLVEGVHFPHHCDPKLLGYRALAVTLSDLAAMGAEPHSFSLGLTLPAIDNVWLQGFSDGLSELAQIVSIPLIGGDTTKGPLTISIHVQGLVPAGKALKRCGAQAGDKIYVSGHLGDAAGALDFVLKGDHPDTVKSDNVRPLLHKYYRPLPRLILGQWLRDNGATAALDISDGLLGDLSHILKASGVGARLNRQEVPCSSALIAVHGQEKATQLAMHGGDDYEICFTWPDQPLLNLPSEVGCPVTCIGNITRIPGIWDARSDQAISTTSYTHF